MVEVVEDLEERVFNHGDLSNLIVVEPDRRFEGCLAFQSLPEQKIVRTYPDWVSGYGILNELYMVERFHEQLLADGATVLFDSSCQNLLEDYQRWSRPLEIENYTPPGDLYDFQTFGIQKALERSYSRSRANRFNFFGWGTGTGKTLAATGGTQELANRGGFDLVLAFTLRKLKINFCRAFTATTNLAFTINDHESPARRHSRYSDLDVDGFVLNYDKAHFDLEALSHLVSNKRVLFILDEVQKVLTEDRRTRARRGLDTLISKSQSTVWPMSASVVSASPLRYRDLFELAQGGDNPCGRKIDFEDRYLLRKTDKEYTNPRGGTYTVTNYHWDQLGLHEVRHRVNASAQNVRKSDPGVRENFKDLHTIVIPVQLSKEDRKLYRIVEGWASEAKAREESGAQEYRALRYIALSPETLQHSDSKVAERLVAEYPELCSSRNSSKMEMFLDQVEGIRDAGDKVVVFTFWAGLLLPILERELRKRKISLVVHHAGLSDKAAQQAEDDFKENEDITVFLSSDAGTYGLNLQEAKYVIAYECPFSYDTLNQRINRIHRIDSKLDGMTAYVYVCEDTVEDRMLDTNDYRRQLSSDTTGARETLSYSTEEAAIPYMLFGD